MSDLDDILDDVTDAAGPAPAEFADWVRSQIAHPSGRSVPAAGGMVEYDLNDMLMEEP